jgi:hypothetical protein
VAWLGRMVGSEAEGGKIVVIIQHLTTPNSTASIPSEHNNDAGDQLNPVEVIQDNALISDERVCPIRRGKVLEGITNSQSRNSWSDFDAANFRVVPDETIVYEQGAFHGSFITKASALSFNKRTLGQASAKRA